MTIQIVQTELASSGKIPSTTWMCWNNLTIKGEEERQDQLDLYG